ncbi:MAG: hypothetical protein IPK70_11375 [Flavobacteriales bacterium]|nr:hypothetical protein [Flavobacteriales bacterium]
MRCSVLLLIAIQLAQGLRAQLVNSGFENGLTGWQTLCPDGTGVSFDAPPYGGDMSARIRCLSATPMDCWIQELVQPMIYQPLVGAQNGTVLQVSAWVKAEPDVPGDEQWVGSVLVLGWLDASGDLQYSTGDCAYVNFGGASADWTPSFLTCTLAGFPPGVTPVLFLGGHAFNNTNGHVLIDNVNIALSGTGVQLSAKAWLEGAYVAAQNLMRDDLRAAGYIPLSEPNGAVFQDGPGTETVQPSVLASTGSNAIVDWVRLELHLGPYPDGATTLVSKRNALIQRDGDIVDVDGVSPVTFATGPGNYHVVVRHRNHLPVMNTFAVPLNSTPFTIDFRTSALACFSRPAPFNDQPLKSIGSARVLWSGNVEQGALVLKGLYYVGQWNDRDPILLAVGGATPTATITGYHQADVNLDGMVKYVGANNDRDPILLNIGGSTPTNVRKSQVYPY